MHRKKRYFGMGIIVFTLLYIWNNSLQSAIVSNGQSGKVLEIIEEIFQTPPLDTEEAQHIVRKAAHVLEFALLGFEMALFLYISRKMRRQNLAIILFVGLASAVMDETIQIFSQRGSMVADIWIDYTGYTLGIGFALISNTLLHKIENHAYRQKYASLDSRYMHNKII